MANERRFTTEIDGAAHDVVITPARSTDVDPPVDGGYRGTRVLTPVQHAGIGAGGGDEDGYPGGDVGFDGESPDIEVDLSAFEVADTERPPPPPAPCGPIASATWCCEPHMYADEDRRQADLAAARAGASTDAEYFDRLGEGERHFVLPALPSDSAARKRIPLCTGVYDYFPDALYSIVDPFDADLPDVLPDDDLVSGYLSYLAIRGQGDGCACTLVSWYSLCILQRELTGAFCKARPQTEHQLFDMFTEALAAVAEVSWYGNEKHNPGQPLHHARGKSADHPDCALRHLAERGGFDGALRHSACLAWRSLAMGQQDCESRGAPLARGARLPTPDTGDAP